MANPRRNFDAIQLNPVVSVDTDNWPGLSRGKTPADYDPIQLEVGTRIEFEHTHNRHVAQRIAMDHLTENSNYYYELAQLEAGALGSTPAWSHLQRVREENALRAAPAEELQRAEGELEQMDALERQSYRQNPSCGCKENPMDPNYVCRGCGRTEQSLK